MNSRYQTSMISKKINGEKIDIINLKDRKTRMEVSSSPQWGGQIFSLKLFLNGKPIETIYLDGSSCDSKEGWRGGSPLLWPAVGRNYTPQTLEKVKKGERDQSQCDYKLNGNKYNIPLHGFAMRKEWKLISTNADNNDAKTKYSLKNDKETYKLFPFNFEIQVEHILSEGKLKSRYTVISQNEGMFFSIGNHLSFKFPFDKKSGFEEGIFRTPARWKYKGEKPGLLTGEKTPLDFEKGVSLSNSNLYSTCTGGFPEDKIEAEILDPSIGGFRVTQKEIPVNSVKTEPEYYLFVLYADSSEGYFCLEPWYGVPNSLNTMKGAVTLNKGEKFVWDMDIIPVNPDGYSMY